MTTVALKHKAEAEYDWRKDAFDSYTLAYRLKALVKGSATFRTLSELYFCESAGVIP